MAHPTAGHRTTGHRTAARMAGWPTAPPPPATARTGAAPPAAGRPANGGGRPGDTASYHAHGKLSDEGPAGDGAGPGGLWGAVTSFFSDLTRRQWLTYGGIAAGFFIIVVAAIIVFQLAVGRPVLGNSFSGHSSRQPA